MFKTNIKKLSLLASMMLCSGAVQAVEFEVLGGTFFMATVSSKVDIIEPGNADGILIEGEYQGIRGTNDNCIDDGPGIGFNLDAALLDQFAFFGNPVCTYTAQNGVDAIDHPAPTIDLINGTADMGSFYAFWNGTEFNQGSTDATVIDNFDGTYKLFWSSLITGGPFNGKTGDWTMVVRCIENEATTAIECPVSVAGASARLSVTQGGVVTHTVTQGDGAFTVSTDITDTTGYAFNWLPTDDAIDGGLVFSDPTLTIDPSAIPVGTYQIKVNVSNNNTDPAEKSVATLLLSIVATGDLATLGDDDNDGVPNASDSITDVTLLQSIDGNNATYIMSTTSGVLTLGDAAICSSSTSAGVTLNDIKNNIGEGCTATGNSTDNTESVVTGISGYYDFIVRDLTLGEQVQVVIPLNESVAKNAGYRSYSFVDGWKPFVSGVDSVATAAGSNGACPAVGDAQWVSGMTEGHNCLKLSITDGGANDADGQGNGVIVSTGTMSSYPGINSDLVQGCSMTDQRQSVKEHMEWLLVLMGVFLLGVVSRRKQADHN